MRGCASEPQSEKTETGRSQQRANKIEGASGSWHARQGLQTDQHRNNAKGDIDCKQPGPWPDREDAGGDRWAEREGGGDYQRIVSEASALQASRIDETNKGRIHTHEAAGPETLNYACRQQCRQRPGAGTSQRREGKQHETN